MKKCSFCVGTGRTAMTSDKNRYCKIIEYIFQKRYRKGVKEFHFERKDIEDAAKELGIELPKNIGDILYSFRYRAEFPESIIEKAPKGFEWTILPAGKSHYNFVLIKMAAFLPNSALEKIKIPDSTPGIVVKYSLDDEQALLAKIRYNRLIDIFTGVTCYSLQNHLRTTVVNIGQVETDEVYAGVDKQGVHYVFPVQAKSGKDKIATVQINQDFAMCAEKFPGLVGRPIAAQLVDDDVIALFEFIIASDGVRVRSEKHYRLVEPEELSREELASYRKTVS